MGATDSRTLFALKSAGGTANEADHNSPDAACQLPLGMAMTTIVNGVGSSEPFELHLAFRLLRRHPPIDLKL